MPGGLQPIGLLAFTALLQWLRGHHKVNGSPFAQLPVIPVATGSSLITAIDLYSCLVSAFDLIQKFQRIPFLRRLGGRTVQLLAFGNLPRVQVKTYLMTFGLAFASSPLACLLLFLSIEPTL